MNERTEVRSLDSLIPYWRNPRRITEEAINAVAESIRQYGYQQPITIDGEDVIITGHTRYAALRRLGYTHASVRIITDLTAQQVKQLRLIDNRTSELASWDYDSLVAEMADLDGDLMSRFFPEVTGEAFTAITSDDPSADPLDWESAAEEEETVVEFVCPACFHQWNQEVHREDVFAGKLRRMEKEAAS